MRKLLIGATAVIITICSNTGAQTPQVILPPSQYDHIPNRVTLEEHVGGAQEVDAVCRKLYTEVYRHPVPLSGVYRGCNYITTDQICIVWRVGDDDNQRRHEYGHCNGWVHADLSWLNRKDYNLFNNVK